MLSPDRLGAIAGVDRTIHLDPRPFHSIERVIYEFGTAVYYKLALFDLRDYERIVYLDLDALLVADIGELWDPDRYADKPFYAVREEAEYGGGGTVADHEET